MQQVVVADEACLAIGGDKDVIPGLHPQDIVKQLDIASRVFEPNGIAYYLIDGVVENLNVTSSSRILNQDTAVGIAVD